jgi:hypothetical protein
MDTTTPSQSSDNLPDQPQATEVAEIMVRQDKDWVHPKRGTGEWITRLAEILLSENLVVLSGLGTSLCLNTPMVRRAPTMGDLWHAVESFEDFKIIVKKVQHDPLSLNIEDLLSRCQLYNSLYRDPQVQAFITASERHIKDSCSFVSVGEQLKVHELFLRKSARRSIRQPRLKLFTTNYDRCFEVAASNSGFVVVDGFSHSTPQVFDGHYFSYDLVKRGLDGESPTFIPNVFHLYKLHGSVDWDIKLDGRVVRGETDAPAMVYPRAGKFESSYQQPFFEMMSRFQSALRMANTGLLVIGYGFSDKHINEPILSALRSNVGLKFAVVDPVLPDQRNHVHKAIIQLVDEGDVRLTAISARFEHLVEHLPDLNHITEEEIHQARNRRLLGL